ncbi:MAG: helix-turn-helix transcriptional regulator [Deltaproteobacteria bacterium]|nr:helix-turn-helix transcriptional regulator [Deltaproteobacteria bacterium]
MPIIDSKLLRRLRMRLGWTQEDLATRVGCDSRTIQRAEQGQGIRLRTAKEISQALDVDLPTIMPPESRDDDQAAVTSNVAGTRNRERKYVYIGNTADIGPFEEIAGKVEDAPNWEATRPGLNVEAYLSSAKAARAHALEFVYAFGKKRHILTGQDIVMYDEPLSSKRATEAHKYRKK